MSDTASVCSSHSAMSVSLSKMECPYCNKDFQVRGMFSHIRKFHSDQLLKNTSERWIDEAMTGQPLRVWWSSKNDFDEEIETVIYACLSTNKTFMTQHKANEHFKKDKAALKDHNKQLKDLKKLYTQHKKDEIKKRKQKSKEDPTVSRWKRARESNDPEMARAIWRGILNYKKVCECALLICKRRKYNEDTPMYIFDSKQRLYEQVPFSNFIVRHNELMELIETRMNEQCLNVKILHSLWANAYEFAMNNYSESIMALHEDLKNLHPIYNYVADEKFYNYAVEEMEGVDF